MRVDKTLFEYALITTHVWAFTTCLLHVLTMSENNDSSRSDRSHDSRGEATGGRASTNSSPPAPSESRTDSRVRSGDIDGDEPFTRTDWEELRSDPDVRADLGYAIAPWESIDTATESTQVIFMPQNEDLLKDDTFIVADQDVLCDLGKQY